ncbi:Arca-like protein [Lasiodiplodia theobromae]|uniref:Arca-like protein n=1 Tax=Lasiodiplodia theobromae TaxID=45133 RepID=UPI0015C34C3D|nr:Arca-like protein [Lasiodiplodia theobromae]KAF4541330.1 Arca-like protein [Lasiodiplodia theobromae]
MSWFRHFNAPRQPGQKQIWLPIPPKVDFVDETGDVIDGAADGDSSQEDPEGSAPPLPRQQSVPEDIIPDASLLDVGPSPAATSGPHVFEQNYPSPSVASPFSNHRVSSFASSPTYAALRELSRSHHHAIPEPSVSIAPSTPSQSRAINQWPLQSEEEAMLLRFFLEHISTFFDLCDPYRYFRYEVPQRARTNKTLANAILAISARMLHWKTGGAAVDAYVADRYYQLCLSTLIPSLSDVEAVCMDETLLAATVVLRMLEEMDVHISGADTRGHLTGSQAIISVATANLRQQAPTGLRRAAYWSAFRQEVWIAPQTQQPITMSPAVCGYEIEHGFGPAPDWVWCERAIAHCGAAMNVTLGSATGMGREEQVRRWKALMEDNDRWWQSVPGGYEPFFGGWECCSGRAEEGEGGQMFPDVRFQADWHVMGYSYTIEAHLLLVVHDPTIPKLGPLRKRAVAEMDERAKEDVRKLCGLAQSNEFAPAASLIACGDRFVHLAEQKILHNFLNQTERKHGWPTAKARSQLVEAWGWQHPHEQGESHHSGSPAELHPMSIAAAMTPPP